MRHWESLPTALLLASAMACTHAVNTVPAPISPTDPVQYYDLEVPADLEIRSADFSATTFADVRGGVNSGVGSTVNGRAFVKVYAVHRTTGEHFLLLYEDVAHRRRPMEVIRFVRGADAARPDSAR